MPAEPGPWPSVASSVLRYAPVAGVPAFAAPPVVAALTVAGTTVPEVII